MYKRWGQYCPSSAYTLLVQIYSNFIIVWRSLIFLFLMSIMFMTKGKCNIYTPYSTLLNCWTKCPMVLVIVADTDDAKWPIY